jgi:hypothetical protein
MRAAESAVQEVLSLGGLPSGIRRATIEQRIAGLREYVTSLLIDLPRVRPESCPSWLSPTSPSFVFDALVDEVFSPSHGTVVVKDQCIRDLAERDLTPDYLEAFVGLYYLHELRHHKQGLESKEHVASLIGANAQEALAEFDLAADHVAVEDLTHLRWVWSTAQLKVIQSEALMDFPAGPGHTKGAHLRKSIRLASVRMDALMRQSGPMARRTWNGHVSVRFGVSEAPHTRSEGQLIVLRHADQLTLIGKTSLISGELEALRNAAGIGRTLVDLDRVLLRCLGDFEYLESR